MDDQVEMVCDFLKNRNVKDNVIGRFKEQKMDYQAVVMSTSEELEKLGCVKGDAMNLKFYVNSQIETEKKAGSSQEKKELLNKILSEGTQSRKRKRSSSKIPVHNDLNQTRKVTVGWLNYDKPTRSYKQVKTAKGGGVCVVDLPLTATHEEIVANARNLFFENESSSFGDAKDMEFGLANFQRQPIEAIEFSVLKNYIDKYKRKLIKLFLTSKKKMSEIVSVPDGSDCDSSLHSNDNDIKEEKHDDRFSECSVDWLDIPVWDLTEVKKPVEQNLEDRRKLIAQQDEEFQRSLKADQAKKLKLIEEEERVKRQHVLMNARKARVLEEPGPEEVSILVRVRHVTLGLVERRLRSQTQMSAVYDWIGSLGLIPENFILSEFSKDLLPHECIPNTACVLNMKETFTTPSLDQSGSVNFKGFGLPNQLMEDDPSSDEETPSTSRNCTHTQLPNRTKEPGRYFRQVVLPQMLQSGHSGRETCAQDQSQAEYSNHTEGSEDGNDSGSHESESQNNSPPGGGGDGDAGSEHVNTTEEAMPKRVIKIRRCTIMADMIKHFKDKTIMSSHIIVVMVNSFAEEENGVDNNGVFLDALSAFWSEFYDACTTGEGGRVPVIRHDFQREEWEAVAHILVKGYHQVKFFPIKLNQAFVVASIMGEKEVTSDMLLACFLQYASNDEKELIEASLSNELKEEQSDEWLDFLDRFQCKTIPKPEQVKNVLEEIAHKELIQCPRYITDCWMQPCKMLKRDLSTAADINQLYERARPSNKKILALLTSNPINNAERDAFSYLQRYVRGISQEKLQKFLRYCTGSTMICVSHITVMFSSLDGCARRPVAHTCGAVLEMPTTYASFPQFREEMNNILTGEYWDIDFL